MGLHSAALLAGTLLVASLVGASTALGARAVPPPAITFAAVAAGDRLVVTTPRYVLSLSRKTGTIAELVDRASGTRLLAGESGCLWGGETKVGQIVGGCLSTSDGARRPGYAWDQRSTTLTLVYPGDGPSVSARVALTAGLSSFDLRLTLENRLQDDVVSGVYFPADLLGPSATVKGGYAPTYLPGIRLKPAFFAGQDGVVFTYPGRWAFADYLAFDAGASSLALYSVNPAPSPIQPVELGFVRQALPDPCAGPFFCLRHMFDTWIVAGAAWASPTVRVQVGQTAQESILAYRHDNGIDAYPSLADKLGARLPALSQAPLIKADLRKGLPPFREWGPSLRRLPSPALLHPVAYQVGGHDARDPDFLPPDPELGTTADLRAAVEDAHSLGLLVMPYLNVSWWSVDSPTLAALPAPLGVKDLAVQNVAGDPRLEQYGARRGYVVSPYAPYVKDRLASLLGQWRTEVPADCLFFDQIGARPWLRDFNPAAPSPLAYDDGWLAQLAPYATRCLMVEDGWDRLAAISVGFHGGLLLLQRGFGEPDVRYGAGNWEPYPLALWLLHDKVLLYQHDLYEGTLTADLEVLRWNTAFGVMLSYNWDGDTSSLDSPWLDVVGSFQQALGPYFAGQPLISYFRMAPGVTRSIFRGFSVLTNWNGADGYDARGSRLAPGGFLAQSTRGAVLAGVFEGMFNGAPLSPGTHYLVVERSPTSVTVHQPLGGSTELSIELPSAWVPGTPARVTTAGLAVDGAVVGRRIVFQCLGPAAGRPAPTYRVSIG